MKQVFLVLMMVLWALGDAQQIYTISGAVTNILDKTPIPDCTVNLKIDSIVTFITKTDSSGKYKFELTNPNFKKALVYLSTDKNLKTPTAKCAFLATEDQGEFSIRKDSTYSMSKNFGLHPVNDCDYWSPTFYFKKNSTEYNVIYRAITENMDSSDYEPEIALNKIKELLIKYPSIIIQFDCHCSSEEGTTAYADKLSVSRSEKIKIELIKRGINEKRIEIRGWGERKLKIPDAVVKKAKTKEEKEALHAVNRRCVFKILSWDFDDGTSKKTEIPTYKPPIQKEGEQENLLPIKPD